MHTDQIVFAQLMDLFSITKLPKSAFLRFQESEIFILKKILINLLTFTPTLQLIILLLPSQRRA